MRAALLGCAVLVAACKTVAPCASHTLFVTTTLTGEAAQADAIRVQVAVAEQTLSTTIAHTPGQASGSIEVQFPKGYPAGKAITLTLTAERGGLVVGSGAKSATLAADCDTLSVDVIGGATPDGSAIPDGGTGLALGARCADNAACASGYCVDGVCCDSACSGQCQACDVTAGTCTPVTSGQPHGTRTACGGAGTPCAGACADGNSDACTYPGASTSCRSASCANGVKTLAAGCDGAGACPAAATVTCNPLACNSAGTDCSMTCANDTQCGGSTPYCNAGACLATKPDGRACNSSNECTNANCVDKFCCNSACGGSCQQCNLSGQEGKCLPSPKNSGGRSCTATQYCDGSNSTCQNCPAVPAANALHFVDATYGTDDTAHGSGYGRCGYKTATFGLKQATGQLALATGTYSAASGETMPLVLTGGQQITCTYLQPTPATIRGKGLYNRININVVMAYEGSNNAIYGCILDGGGGLGYCLDVNASGNNYVSSADISNCGGSAVNVESNMTGLQVSTSKLHDSLTGIFWIGTNSGSLVNNAFSNNSNADIQCQNADTGVTGNGNTGMTNGKPKCVTCGNCPF
jgi:hypothetical protein